MDTPLTQAKACRDAASALSDGPPPVDIDIPVGPIRHHPLSWTRKGRRVQETCRFEIVHLCNNTPPGWMDEVGSEFSVLVAFSNFFLERESFL